MDLLRRRNMMQGAVEIIPAVLLAEAYVMTDILFSGDLEFDGRVGYGNNRDPRNSIVFGTQDLAGGSEFVDRYLLIAYGQNPRHEFVYATTWLGDQKIANNPSLNHYSGKIIGTNFRFDIDNVVHYDTPARSFVVPRKLCIGGYYNSSDDPISSGPIIVSDITFSRGGVELARFKAAKRGSEYGLYDELTNTFLAKSGGTGEITPFNP